MKLLKRIANILVLFLVLSCTIGAAMAEEEKSYQVVHSDDSKNADDEKDSGSITDRDGELSADEIYSENKVMGQEKGNGKLSDLFDVDQYIATISAFDVVWAIIMLAFAIVGGAIIIGYVGVIFWNALKKIVASKGENAEQAVNEIRKINSKDTSVTIGVGFSLVLASVFIALVRFL